MRCCNRGAYGNVRWFVMRETEGIERHIAVHRVGFLRRREFRGTCVRGPLLRPFAVEAVCGGLATLLPHRLPFWAGLVGAGTRIADWYRSKMVWCVCFRFLRYATRSPELGVA